MQSASLIKDLSEDSQLVINSIHCQSSYDVDCITVKVLNSLHRQNKCTSHRLQRQYCFLFLVLSDSVIWTVLINLTVFLVKVTGWMIIYHLPGQKCLYSLEKLYQWSIYSCIKRQFLLYIQSVTKVMLFHHKTI
jgi:hypothetical protein